MIIDKCILLNKIINPCSLLQFVQHVKRSKDESLVGLHYLPVHDHLVQYVMRLFDVIHDVQFTHVLEVLIHCLDQIVDKLEIGHLVLYREASTYYSRSSPTMK
jgi:hypothetical protein